MTESRFQLNIEQIIQFLPQRAPFLLIDRVLEIQAAGKIGDNSSENKREGTKVVALKNVTYNEPYMQGHFPGLSIVPGVLLIESLAQTASFSIYPYLYGEDLVSKARSFQCLLVGVNNTRFRRPVVPGDTLRLESVVSKIRGKLWVFECQALVEGQKVVEAELMANLMPNENGVQ